MSYHPIAIYNISKAPSRRSPSLIWGEVIKDRYAVEVQHTGACKGELVIFDAHRNFRLIHEEPVVVHYNGNPVDQQDIELWLLIASGYTK